MINQQDSPGPQPAPGNWPSTLQWHAAVGYGSNGDQASHADSGTPNIARIYDLLLGGKDHLAADRAVAAELLKVLPHAAKAARANRDFLIRTLRFLAGQAGIRQFIDIGTGYPAHTNVHDVAKAISPAARVVYTDNDPVAAAHANALLAETMTVTAVYGDLRLPDELLDLLVARQLIDLDQPVAMLMTGMLHFVGDHEKPGLLVDYYKTRMAEGSYLAISHAISDYLPANTIKAAEQIYQHASATCTFRTYSEITRFLDGLDIVPPGLVNVTEWRPGDLPRRPHQPLIFGGIGRKPAATGILP